MPSIKKKIDQNTVEKAHEQHPRGTIIMDSEVPGLRIVTGSRGSSWRVVGTINDGTSRGITITLGRTNQLTARQAMKEALAMKLRLSNGEDPREEKRAQAPTMKEAFARYLETRRLSPKTIGFYAQMVDGPLKPVASLPLDRFTRERARTLHETITKKSGPAMANGAMRVAKALMNDVLRDIDLPSGNVVSKAVRMNRIEARNWAIPPNDLPKLWHALSEMENRQTAIMWEVALCTGLRCGDVKSMTWEAIDADGVLHLPNPKGGRAFDLPLTEHVRTRLDVLRDLTAPWESRWCFPARSAAGHAESMRSGKGWPWQAHSMRHTWRTEAMAAGVPTDMAMLLLNHSSGGGQTAVSWGYVTRSNLLGPMREAAETVVSRLLSYSGAA